MNEKTCTNCKGLFEGRRNKKFCSISCKNQFHNEAYREENNLVFDVNRALNKNRAILKQLFKVYRSSVVPMTILEAHGFNGKFHTHLFDAPSGTRYTMVYELGFRLTYDNQVSIVELAEVI